MGIPWFWVFYTIELSAKAGDRLDWRLRRSVHRHRRHAGRGKSVARHYAAISCVERTAIIDLTWYGQRWNDRWELLFCGARIIAGSNIRRGLAAIKVKRRLHHVIERKDVELANHGLKKWVPELRGFLHVESQVISIRPRYA